jgi:hypothetical protein
MDDTKSSKKFHCEKCDYTTSRKSQYDRHILTDKHKMDDKEDKKVPKSSAPYFCVCGKDYTYRQGLWKHQKICKNALLMDQNDDYNEIKMLTNLVLDVVKQNKELATQNNELTNKIVDLCKARYTN